MSKVTGVFDLATYLANKLKNAPLDILTIIEEYDRGVICEDNTLYETFRVSYNSIYDALAFNTGLDMIVRSIQEELEEASVGEPTFEDCFERMQQTHMEEASQLASLGWWLSYYKSNFLGRC